MVPKKKVSIPLASDGGLEGGIQCFAFSKGLAEDRLLSHDVPNQASEGIVGVGFASIRLIPTPAKRCP